MDLPFKDLGGSRVVLRVIRPPPAPL